MQETLLATIPYLLKDFDAHPWPVLGLRILFVVVSHFVEVVFVQLPYKTCKVAVFEVLWEYVLCEFLVLGCCVSCCARRSRLMRMYL